MAIGSSGFVLQSVSANGAVNGIALTNLTGGGAVGVQVTGTGSTAGSGGTIQNTTGAAVSITSLGSLGGGVTLNDMNITGGGGILGTAFGTLSVANDSVSATGAPALSLTTGAIAAGSNFSSVTSSGGANGISLTNVTGTTTFTTVAISDSGGDGINLSNAGTVAINGGTIGGTTADGIRSANTNLTVAGVTLGGATIIGGNAIEVTNTSGSSTFAINNVTVANATGAGITVNGAGSATTVTSLSGNTVSKASAGGILFDTVTFDADTATAGIQQVAGGNTAVGNSLATTDVKGDGLRLNNVLGSIGFGTLNIFNDTGTGLFIRTAGGKAGSFALSNTGGAINTTNGAAMDADPVALSSTFTSASTNAPVSGINLNTITGTLNLGNVSVTNAATTGLVFVNSSAAVTAGTVTINGAITGLQFGVNTGGSFTATGATNLTNITTTGINANGATGTYLFRDLTIGFTGAVANTRGIDLRSSDLQQFETGNLSIAGNGTATSIAVDLSGSLYPGGQPVTVNAPNILFATAAGETAVISNVGTGVKLGDGTVGSAGAYLRYGNQTPIGSGGSGSSMAVIGGGVTIDTANLTSTTGFTQGRYEFTGVSLHRPRHV